MGLIQQQRGITGPIWPGAAHWHAEGAESGGAGGRNKKPADHLHVPELFGGYPRQFG